MIDVAKYTYTIRPTSPTDERTYFIATCLELPDLEVTAPFATAALERAVAQARETVATMQDPPEPYSTRNYSGHISVRVPPSRHRELVRDAVQHGLSLNTFISRKLAR